MSPAEGSASITIVGVGPGDPRMLTLRGQVVLENADLVAGFKSVLDVVRPRLSHAEVCPMTYRDQEEVLEYVAGQARGGRTCVVCCWGDFNVSARELLARVRRHADHVDMVPGISSVQIACAKASISMEEALFITLHQRSSPADDMEELVHYLRENRRHVILLPRPWDLMPAAIATHLMEAGLPGHRPVSVYQRLTLEGEQEWCGTLEECAVNSSEHSDLTILVFPRTSSENESAQRE